MRLLDLFCGAGGAAVGYHRAGFDEIVGVDIKPMPRYPFQFVQADALEFCKSFGAGFDAIHASPPCQMYSIARVVLQDHQKNKHWDSIKPTRSTLLASGRPYVIENVENAPLSPFAATVCGLSLGLRTKRHRRFESSIFLLSTTCLRGHPGEWYSIHGNGANRRYTADRPRGASRWGLREPKREGNKAIRNHAMGIDWMSNHELAQAIPPAYTEFIGRQLLAHLAES